MAKLEAAEESQEKEEDEKARGEMKGGCLTLFIRRRVTGGREKRGGQRMIIHLIGRLDFREVIKR